VTNVVSSIRGASSPSRIAREYSSEVGSHPVSSRLEQDASSPATTATTTKRLLNLKYEPPEVTLRCTSAHELTPKRWHFIHGQGFNQAPIATRTSPEFEGRSSLST
jgi:hypothetical protein